MLHRNRTNSYLVISQPAHAWLSGQLAAAWGNNRFGEVHPHQEVVLAAEQHDIGWLAWEANPTLNPQTGRPRTFMELPTSEHVSVWEPAGPMSLVYGPYVALLVSMHGTGLYQRHDFKRDNEAEAQAARRFIANGAAFEERLVRQMAEDDRYNRHSDRDTLARNRRLVAVWDALSLMLCAGLESEREISNVPSVDGAISIKLHPDAGNFDRVRVDPWPFTVDRLELAVAGRRLADTFSGQAAMRAALDVAPWESLTIELLENPG